MSNVCDNCINLNSIQCPIMGREVCQELGLDERNTSEDEEVTPPHNNSVLRLMTTI